MVDKVHHVQVSCKNIDETLRIFVNKFGFKLYCKLTTRESYVLQQQSMLLVLNKGPRDTVYNIAFEVKTNLCNLLKNFDEDDILEEARTTSDKHGQVVSALVKSPVGNVVHTLLDSSEYNGPFLPGYVTCPEVNNHNGDGVPDRSWLTHYDHITYACHAGTSHSIIKWYENHFGFSRFSINSSEDVTDGYVIRSEGDQLASFGMRLTAMEFWHCAEIGLQSGGKGLEAKVKLVLAEPLPGQGPNQVQSFLTEHGEPGVQHIGLHTDRITSVVSTLKEQGVKFIIPPKTYYSQEMGKQDEAESLGVPFDEIVRLGILLDCEFDDTNGHNNADKVETINELNLTKKYLMQIFTKPLFDKETFFLEIIQRHGATGFGAGNIRALWMAINANLQIV